MLYIMPGLKRERDRDGDGERAKRTNQNIWTIATVQSMQFACGCTEPRQQSTNDPQRGEIIGKMYIKGRIFCTNYQV